MMTHEIVSRPAAPADAYALAELSIMAGDGMYEFLLEDFAPKDMLAGLMAGGMKQESTGGSNWRHCFLEEEKGGAGVVAMINAFPAAWLRSEERDNLPQDRVQILDPIDQAQDWDSFLINGVAVRTLHRRRGLATRLVAWAIEQARRDNLPRLSVNVWEDNTAARALFEKQGFHVHVRVEVPPHPALRHIGGSLVMTRQVESRE